MKWKKVSLVEKTELTVFIVTLIKFLEVVRDFFEPTKFYGVVECFHS